MTVPGFVRQVIYDTRLAGSEQIAQELGLPPVSTEVEEMEEKASEERLAQIHHLIPMIASHSEIAAQIALAAYKTGGGGEPTEHLEHMVRVLSFSSALSCVSTLAELGLIEVGELNV